MKIAEREKHAEHLDLFVNIFLQIKTNTDPGYQCRLRWDNLDQSLNAYPNIKQIISSFKSTQPINVLVIKTFR